MHPEIADRFIAQLHDAQQELYRGGDVTPVRRLLDPNVVWHVPGKSPIAGRHEGVNEVVAYMLRRRDLANRTFQMHRRELLVGGADHFAALTDGSAVIGGTAFEWSTVGLYRLLEGRLAECRLLPFDQAQFDAIWGTGSGLEGGA
jgi:uncharacterized protein